MLSLMNTPELVRNLAVIGHMQHGKTCFIDNLVSATHVFDDDRKAKVPPEPRTEPSIQRREG